MFSTLGPFFCIWFGIYSDVLVRVLYQRFARRHFSDLGNTLRPNGIFRLVHKVLIAPAIGFYIWWCGQAGWSLVTSFPTH